MTKTKTRTVTKFVIALCPSSKVYLASFDPVFREGMNIGQTTVGVPSKATQFDCFDDALAVAKTVKGWLGWRVEEISVEVEDTRSTIATDDDLYEIRDAATAAYTEAEGDTYSRAREVEGALRDLGLLCRTNGDLDGDGSVAVYVSDHLGNTAQFDWDGMQDGFDITEATCLADDGPRRHDDKQVQYNNNLVPRIVCPIVPDDAEDGTAPIFLALVGLTDEQKIVALANALHLAGVTIHRVDEDGAPIIRASTPTDGTATVLNI